MFLSEEQAAILIHDRSTLTHPIDIKQEVSKMQNITNGYRPMILDNGAILYADREGFYLLSQHEFNCDILSLYEHLDILDQYYSWCSSIDFKHFPTLVKKMKSAYKQYKLDRLRQVA